MANTKILATLGPASFNKLEEMIKAGLDGFRINMSHVKDYEFIAKLISDIRRISPYTFIAADLEGPKMRLGTFEKPIPITLGQEIKIAPQSDCPVGYVPIQVEHLYKHIGPGNNLLINDGAVKLEVTDIKDKIIYSKVICGTQLESRKGVNIPGVYVPMEFLDEKDKKDLEFLIKYRVDYVNASFTQRVENLIALRERMGNSIMEITAKIENPEGVKNFDSILEYADAIMVARGDLGMEFGVMYVPAAQKMMIKKCNRAGKMVITATQMLEGMINGLEPKRAEVSDIFNAVIDGTDVVMLSGETSMGQYPVEAVRMMNCTVEEAEKYMKSEGITRQLVERILPYLTSSTEDSISSAVNAAMNNAKYDAIITTTRSGLTTAKIARFRQDVPIISLTNDYTRARQLNAIWGVNSYVADIDLSNPINAAMQYVAKNNILKPGSKVIIVYGSKEGTTDTLGIREL